MGEFPLPPALMRGIQKRDPHPEQNKWRTYPRRYKRGRRRRPLKLKAVEEIGTECLNI
jgi:hypothetical protein